MNDNSLDALKSLDYPVKVEYDAEDGLFVAEFLDLPGCSAVGSTVAEAYERAQEAKAEWLRLTLEQRLPVPKPSSSRDYSGRILVRVPTSLHASLVDKARMNGVSLNQYIVHVLSAGAANEQVTSALEAVVGHLQQIELRMAEEFSCPPRMLPAGGDVVSDWQIPRSQARLVGNSALDQARVQ